MKRKVGLVGFGVIGTYLYRSIVEDGFAEIGFVHEVDRERTKELDPSLLTASVEEALERGADLVVETAHPAAVKMLGPKVFRHADLLAFSLTAFADEAFHDEMVRAARGSGRCIYIPHGAVLGLDGLRDGRELIESVTITTIKSPKSLGLNPAAVEERKVVYEGSTRDACRMFPRNVNVHAGIALAGVGFDRTTSRIVADPATPLMTHCIEVDGKGLRWRIQVESRKVGDVTGSYTPESVCRTVRRICERAPVWRIV